MRISTLALSCVLVLPAACSGDDGSGTTSETDSGGSTSTTTGGSTSSTGSTGDGSTGGGTGGSTGAAGCVMMGDPASAVSYTWLEVGAYPSINLAFGDGMCGMQPTVACAQGGALRVVTVNLLDTTPGTYSASETGIVQVNYGLNEDLGQGCGPGQGGMLADGMVTIHVVEDTCVSLDLSGFAPVAGVDINGAVLANTCG